MRGLRTPYHGAVTAGRRSIGIDIVRLAAIIAVVWRHAYYDPGGIVANIVCPWAIAVFFVLSGYLWSSRKTLADEIDSRTTGLLLPYAAWMLVIGVPFFAWAFATTTRDELPTVLMFLAAWLAAPQLLVIPFSACWFFTTMFTSIVVMRFLSRYHRALTWVVLALVLAASVVIPTGLRILPFGAGLGLICLVFLITGQELRRVRHRITHPLIVGLGLIGLGIAACLAGTTHAADGTLLEIKHGDYGVPVLGLLTGAVISAGFILVAEAVETLFSERAGRLVTRSAATATFVMFLHPCLLLLMQTPETGRLADFLIAWFVPYLLALWLMSKGWLPWLTGAPRPPLGVSARLSRIPVLGRRWAALAAR